MEFDSVAFQFEARFATLGTLTPKTKSIWFVIHGYGQLAQYFIRKFAPLESEDIFVVAPEGLSRFYLEDLTSRVQTGNNRVGASWMTKENRQMDVDNYIRYLDTVFHKIVDAEKNIPVTVLGFSQGAATASRWVTHGGIHFQRLILWAGVFPPDMDFVHAREQLHAKETHLVYGNADPFLNDTRFAEMKTVAEKLKIEPVITTFEGGHDIDPVALKKFI
jgi:predicted esterase